MAAAIQALCSSGFTSSLCNSFTLRHFAFSWRTRDDSPTPLATRSFEFEDIGKEKSLVLPVYMYVTRKGKLQNKDRTNSSRLISLLPQSM